MKMFCGGALALLFAIPAAADSLSGRVVDPDGAAVANAEITLLHRTSGNVRKTTTSASGDYSFPNLAPGTYLIEGQAPGATMTGSMEVIVAGDNTQNLTLGIARSTVRVLVTATNTPLSEQEVAKVIDVVDLEEINLRDEYAVAEAVRNVPGVRVKQLGGPGSFTSIKTRGLRNQDTAVLIDGLRFRDAASTQGDVTSFFEDMLVVDASRIEYLRGSGSSLYGTNAMAGVINISSNQGGGRMRGSLRGEGGGLGLRRFTANTGGGIADDRFIYSGGFAQLNSDGVRGKGPYRNTGGQVYGKANFNDRFSVSARFWGSDNKLRSEYSPAFPASITANFPATGPVKAIPLPDRELERFEAGQPFTAGNATFVPSHFDPDGNRLSSFVAASVLANYQLAPDAAYRFSYQGVNTNRAFRNGPLGAGDFEPPVPTLSRFDGRTDTIQHRLDARAGAYNLLNMGYEFEREQYSDLQTDARPTTQPATIDIQQHSHAVFGQDQIQLLDNRLQIAFSGRIQMFELRQPNFTGNLNPYRGVRVESPENAYTGDISAAYFIRTTGTKLRGHIGNSYRAPAPYERFGGYVFGQFPGFYGDPRLKPEKAVAVDGGLDQWLWNDRIRLGATYFYTDLRETIMFTFSNFPANDPFGRFGGYLNTRRGGISRGVELSGQITPSSRTNIQASYTYVNAEQRTPTIGTDFFDVLGQSPHTFTLVATQWLTRRANVTFDFFATDQYSLSPFGALGRRLVFDGPKKGDIVFNYRHPLNDQQSIEFYGKVENMFNNKYYEDGFRSPRAWGIGGIKYNW
jgi:vitamin B12 transporter